MIVLDRNFSWLNEKQFTNYKNEILSEIKDITDALVSQNSLKFIPNISRKILEQFFITIESKYKLNYHNCHDNLNSKIELLKEVYPLDSEIIHKFHQIEILNNNSYDSKTVGEWECINLLNSLFYIFNWFYERQNVDFNFKIYVHKSNNKIVSDFLGDSISKYNNQLLIEKCNLEEWLSNKYKIKIPIYQREYVWNFSNIDDLFKDIHARLEDNKIHFFGTIAGKLIDENGKKFVKIIDGQQRLTTTCLIVCAARDKLIRLNSDYIKNNKFIPNILNNLNDYIINATGTEDGNNALKHILNNNISKLIDYRDTIIWKNYNYIYETKFKDYKNVDDIVNLVSVYLKNFQVSTISFDNECLSNKDEMIIFENINSRGQRLAFTEIIKNYILNLCSSDIIDNNQTQINNLYNSKIISNSDNEKSLEKFFNSLISYSIGEETKKDEGSNFRNFKFAIEDLFEIHDDSIKTLNEFESFLNSIEKKLDISNQLESKNFTNSNEIFICKTVHVLLASLEKKKRLLLLNLTYLINDFVKLKGLQNESTIEQIFITFIKFIVKVSTVEIGNSNLRRYIIQVVNEMRNEFIIKDNTSTIDDLLNYVIKKFEIEPPIWWNYNNLKPKLESMDSKNMILPVLLLTELHMNNFNANAIKNIDLNATMIMPKELNNNWLNYDLFNEAEHHVKTNLLGNYLLLPKNKSKNIFSFNENKTKIYNNLNSLLYRNNNTHIDVSNKLEWKYIDIENRTNALVNYILNKVIKS